MDKIRLKTLAGLINENQNPDSLTEVGSGELYKAVRRDVDVLFVQYKDKKKQFKKKLEQMVDSVFTKEVATKIAEKHFIGKTLKELQPNLLGFGEDLENAPISKVSNVDFQYDPDGSLKDSLSIVADLEFENGETADEYSLEIYD
jgi:hypothetical protein